MLYREMICLNRRPGIGNFGPAEISSNPNQTHLPVTF